jgi:type IX secretion system PorP/SprF family membrane protein
LFTVKKLLLTFSLLCSVATYAQQRYTFSQHEQNAYSYIPAVAGVDGAYHVNSAAHIQTNYDSLAWQSLALNVSGPLNMLPVSVGVGVLNEQTNHYILSTTQLTGAYQFERGKNLFSVAASLGMARLEFTPPMGDSLLDRHRYLPDFGVSAFFMRGIFYAGVAIQHIGNISHHIAASDEYIGKSLRQQIYVLGGANISFPTAQLALKPSVMLSYMSGRAAASASLMLGWRDMLWLGASGKTSRLHQDSGQLAFMAGVNILKKYMLTYSYDMGLHSPSQRPVAHEISLGITFEKLRQK